MELRFAILVLCQVECVRPDINYRTAVLAGARDPDPRTILSFTCPWTLSMCLSEIPDVKAVS